MVPRDLAMDVPDSIRLHEAEIFGMYLCMTTDGASLSKACETTSFSFRSAQVWAGKYPEWIAEIQRRALTQAANYKLALTHRLSAARINIELQAKRLVLDAMLGIVRSTIQEALGGNLPAVRLVRTWAAEGLGLVPEDQDLLGSDEEPEIKQLAYDPTQPLSRADVRSPPGTVVTVTVETPEEPIEVMATEVPHGTSV